MDAFEENHEDVLAELCDAANVDVAQGRTGPRDVEQHAAGGAPVRCLRSRVAAPSPLDANALLAALRELVEPEGRLVAREKPDGEPRIDLFEPDGALHSVTCNHGRRVLQLTSFSAPADGGRPAAATIEQRFDAGADVRIVGLDLEERIVGPDYPDVP